MRCSSLTKGVIVLAMVVWGAGCGDDDGNTNSNDTTPPGPVTHVIVEIGDGSVTLQWSTPAADYAYTQIRRVDASAGEVTADTGEVVYEGSETTTYTDTGLSNGAAYLYGLIAFDAAGNASEVTQVMAVLPPTEPVTFNDSHLEEAVRMALGKPSGDLTTTDLLQLTSLEATDASILDLTGLEHAVNLRTLDLSGNALDDTSNDVFLHFQNLTGLNLSDNLLTTMPNLASLPLLWNLDVSGNAGLTSVGTAGAIPSLQSLVLDRTGITALTALSGAQGLTTLTFHETDVSDLSPLSDLDALEMLAFNGTPVDDLSPIQGCTALKSLMAAQTLVQDVSPLSGLAALTDINLAQDQIHDVQGLVDNSDLGVGARVYLSNNPLLHDAVATQIPALQGRGVEVINSEGLPTDMVGVYTAASVTVDGTATDPATFFEWDPTTTTMRLTLYFNNAYRSEELDASDAVVYFNAGIVSVSGSDVTLQMTDDNGTAVDPPEDTFQGTWSASGDDLIFTQQDGGDTIVLTFTRSS